MGKLRDTVLNEMTTDPKVMMKLSAYEDQILNLIGQQNQDDAMTTSDIQSAVAVIVNNIYEEGKKMPERMPGYQTATGKDIYDIYKFEKYHGWIDPSGRWIDLKDYSEHDNWIRYKLKDGWLEKEYGITQDLWDEEDLEIGWDDKDEVKNVLLKRGWITIQSGNVGVWGLNKRKKNFIYNLFTDKGNNPNMPLNVFDYKSYTMKTDKIKDLLEKKGVSRHPGIRRHRYRHNPQRRKINRVMAADKKDDKKDTTINVETLRDTILNEDNWDAYENMSVEVITAALKKHGLTSDNIKYWDKEGRISVYLQSEAMDDSLPINLDEIITKVSNELGALAYKWNPYPAWVEFEFLS